MFGQRWTQRKLDDICSILAVSFSLNIKFFCFCPSCLLSSVFLTCFSSHLRLVSCSSPSASSFVSSAHSLSLCLHLESELLLQLIFYTFGCYAERLTNSATRRQCMYSSTSPSFPPPPIILSFLLPLCKDGGRRRCWIESSWRPSSSHFQQASDVLMAFAGALTDRCGNVSAFRFLSATVCVCVCVVVWPAK